jgi:sulfate adenylyltransferase subunit 2
MAQTITHLKQLEAESIHIFREVAAEFQRPVMLYSVGKDSSVLLHLARKAFAPGHIPFPLLHIDTTWKFQEMIRFRDRMAQQHGLELLTHTNADGLAQGINPFTHGSAVHTDIMKTQALKQALSQYQFDAAFGGARRDEEKSRAKERIFSLREPGHRWDPRQQRPELWHSFNTKIRPGQSMRAFPMSDWTELDVWRYIERENIEVVPLYFSKMRPSVMRGNQIIMVDDERYRINENETPEMRQIRFRTLGCYPLTAASESTATTIGEIIAELEEVSLSERATRLIDGDREDSMERKKIEGYF